MTMDKKREHTRTHVLSKNPHARITGADDLVKAD